MEQVKSYLKQVKFYPKQCWRFVLDIPGIDAFLVKSVARAPYVAPDKHGSNSLDGFLAHKKLIVTLHDSIAPSAEQEVEELINNMGSVPNIRLKLLDPCGTVVGERIYSDVILERVDYDVLDYASNKSSEIVLTFRYAKQKLNY